MIELIRRSLSSVQEFLKNAGESSYTRRPVSGDMRIVENNRANQAQPEIGSRVPAQRDGYQAFLDNFSQSRLDPTPLPRARDGFAVHSFKSFENSAPQVSTQPRYEDQPSGSVTKLRPEEARSPVRYVERPMRVQEERRPVFYDNTQPAPDRYVVDRPPPIREYTQPPPEGDSPTYVRTVRRPVVVLE